MNSIDIFNAPPWGKINNYIGIRYAKHIDDNIYNFVRFLKIPLFDDDEILKIHNARIDLKNKKDRDFFLSSSYDICSFAIYKSNLAINHNGKYYKFGCLFIIDSWILRKSSDTKIMEFSKALSNRHLKEHLKEDVRDKIISRHFELFKKYKEF